MSRVNVCYSDFNTNKIENVIMPLFNNVSFEVGIKDYENKIIKLSMRDNVSSNVELDGEIDFESLNSLLKSLSAIKRQLERMES